MTKSLSQVVEPEFSSIVQLDKIPVVGLEQALVANVAQREKLAKRFDLKELSKLQASLSIKPAHAGQVIMVTGTLIADVVQTCVVTLEPLSSHIEHSVNVLCALPENLDDYVKSTSFDSDQEVEPIVNGGIDLGEIVAQQLGIVLDPYPRKPGASFSPTVLGEVTAAQNPFVTLLDLKKKPKN